MAKEGRSFSARERNCCFFNTGSAPGAGGRFANVSAVSGLDFPDDGRAVVPVDWDHDGDLDLWIANRNAPQLRLMRNDTSTTNHYITLRLEGQEKTINRDAVGARVEIVLGPRIKGQGSRSKREAQEGQIADGGGDENTAADSTTSRSAHPASRNRLIKTLRAGEGFISQSSKWLHFGLGSASRIEVVTVRWPGGKTEEFRNLELDRRYHILQGTGEARLVDAAPRQTMLNPSATSQMPLPSDTARIPLVILLNLPQYTYKEFDGRQSLLPTQSGHPLLVNLWASWCSPCVVELGEFTRRQDEIKAKGIQILALSVDGLGEDSSSPTVAARTISQIGFPFAAGRATSQLVDFLQTTHDKLIAANRPLPLPTSFLIDAQGRLAVIYKGSVSIDDLLEDVTHSEQSRIDRFARSAPLGGRPIAHQKIENTRINAETAIRFLLASRLQQARRFAEAEIQHREVLKLRPDAVHAHNDLGYILEQQGKYADALAHYRRAVQIQPTYAVAYNNLGNVLQSQGQFSEAMDQYRRALEINPTYAVAYNNLGNALQRQGQFSAAEKQYRRALEISPHMSEFHYNLGNVLLNQGLLDEAAREYRLVLQLAPNLAEAHYKLGYVLQQQGRHPEARRHFTRARQIKPELATATAKPKGE